jgi:hypothetical protein
MAESASPSVAFLIAVTCHMHHQIAKAAIPKNGLAFASRDQRSYYPATRQQLLPSY